MITLALDAVGVRCGARTVLQNITVPAMRGGEVVAVIGPNGAGKSTLLRCIAGLVAGPGRVQTESGEPRPARACYLPQDTTATALLTMFESILLAVKRDASSRPRTRPWRRSRRCSASSTSRRWRFAISGTCRAASASSSRSPRPSAVSRT